ncbi:unnamed protein product [Adineta ricciae]|uniref:Uncharacterized protein n=1 Tax=Adineta ricciae TaxID=249248 RepID=A0A814H8N1_ADIRI|nr:unnamed protein product [Adineta ricciae]
MMNDEHEMISSLDKQLQIYRQISLDFNQLSQLKQQFNSFFSTDNRQDLVVDLLNTKTSLTEKSQQEVNFNDLCSAMINQIQQRINQLNKIENNDEERNSTIIQSYEDALTKTNLDFTKQFVHLANIRLECAKLRHRLQESKREVLSRRASNEQGQLLTILDAMIASKSIENHLNLLKKKVQTEAEQTKKSQENLLPQIHQQITEQRNQLNRIDQQLNKIIQENLFDKLEKLESKIRDYTRLISEFPQHIHSLNILHLSLSNQIRSNLFTWSNEQFNQINLTNQPIIQSSPTPLPEIPSQTPSTPLTSLKQLLGIRTQDSTILEPPATNDSSTKQETQHWDIPSKDEDMFKIICPSLTEIDWQMLNRVDQQIEDSLKDCRQDFNQYEELFQNMIKETRVLQYEYREKPAFRS